MKIKDLSVPAQFRKYALQMVDAPLGFEYGKETPIGADCSGVVCYPLLMMGWKIRTSADSLYQYIFTKKVWERDRNNWKQSIRAVFFIARRPWHKPGWGPMEAGTAFHVAPLVGRNTLVHADSLVDQIYLVDAVTLAQTYDYWGFDIVWREIDFHALDQHNGVLYASIDPEFQDIKALVDRGILDE